MSANIIDFESAKEKRWAVGVNNHGHDHFDYTAIIDGLINEVVVECGEFDLASYIVKLHNAELKCRTGK